MFVMAAKEGMTKNMDLLITFACSMKNGAPPGSSEKQSRFGNVYYHCNVSCVKAVWPTFIPSSVVVPIEMQSKLLPEHNHFMYVTFGLSLM